MIPTSFSHHNLQMGTCSASLELLPKLFGDVPCQIKLIEETLSHEPNTGTSSGLPDLQLELVWWKMATRIGRVNHGINGTYWIKITAALLFTGMTLMFWFWISQALSSSEHVFFMHTLCGGTLRYACNSEHVNTQINIKFPIVVGYLRPSPAKPDHPKALLTKSGQVTGSKFTRFLCHCHES